MASQIEPQGRRMQGWSSGAREGQGIMGKTWNNKLAYMEEGTEGRFGSEDAILAHLVLLGSLARLRF